MFITLNPDPCIFVLAECVISRHYLQKLKQEEMSKPINFVQIVVGPCKETSLGLEHGVTCCFTSVLSPKFFFFLFFSFFQQLKNKKNKKTNTQTKPDTKKCLKQCLHWKVPKSGGWWSPLSVGTLELCRVHALLARRTVSSEQAALSWEQFHSRARLCSTAVSGFIRLKVIFPQMFTDLLIIFVWRVKMNKWLPVWEVWGRWVGGVLRSALLSLTCDWICAL